MRLGVRERFFSAGGALHPDDEDCGQGVAIPDGWSEDYWLGRPVWNGMCSWVALGDGSLTLLDVIQMHRSLNLREWLEMKMRETVNK